MPIEGTKHKISGPFQNIWTTEGWTAVCRCQLELPKLMPCGTCALVLHDGDVYT